MSPRAVARVAGQVADPGKWRSGGVAPKTIEAANASYELFFGEAGVRVRISDVGK